MSEEMNPAAFGVGQAEQSMGQDMYQANVEVAKSHVRINDAQVERILAKTRVIDAQASADEKMAQEMLIQECDKRHAGYVMQSLREKEMALRLARYETMTTALAWATFLGVVFVSAAALTGIVWLYNAVL